MNGVIDTQISSARWPQAMGSYDHSMYMERQILSGETEFHDMLDMLRRRFIFSNSDAVDEFLKTHRGVVPLLLDAAPYMAKAFGEETPLVLEVMPEDGSPRTLYSLAMWRGDRIEARKALKSFDESWLVRNLKMAAGRIVFDYELI